MGDQKLDLPWTQPGWREQVDAWIHSELDRQGIELSGSIEQPHVRPWSTVLRVPTIQGDVYFKAPAPVLLHEVALTRALADWRPDRLLPLLGIDLKRGWMLLPDGGTKLRELIRAEQDIRRWELLLPTYAELQMDVVLRRDAVLALGVPDRRLTALPTAYEGLLAETDLLLSDRPNGLTIEEYRQLQQLAPRLAATCEELTGYPIPESLHHGDFHDGNVFVRDGHYVFVDWSDSSISHPFFSLRTTLVSVEHTLGLEEGAPAELRRLRDAYLEPWTRYAPRSDLLKAFELAQRLWMIPSAQVWQLIASGLEDGLPETYAHAVPSLLREFLDANA